MHDLCTLWIGGSIKFEARGKIITNIASRLSKTLLFAFRHGRSNTPIENANEQYRHNVRTDGKILPNPVQNLATRARASLKRLQTFSRLPKMNK